MRAPQCLLRHYLQQPGHGGNLDVHQQGTDRQDAVRIYHGISLNHKKQQNYAIRRDVDGPRDCHS